MDNMPEGGGHHEMPQKKEQTVAELLMEMGFDFDGERHAGKRKPIVPGSQHPRAVDPEHDHDAEEQIKTRKRALNFFESSFLSGEVERLHETQRKKHRLPPAITASDVAPDGRKADVAYSAEDPEGHPRQQCEPSRSAARFKKDIEAILAARENPERPFTRTSVDVFFRVETLAMVKSGLQTLPMESRPEYAEDEMIAVAQVEFDVLVNDITRLQASGAPEDMVFKRILDHVNAFPYRKTANSLLAALAGRNREHHRKKRGFLFELARANELPGLNCEGRAKLFCALLEVAGYNAEKDIFLNWPTAHVQTLLKRPDGTWLAFEGNHRRPFIQTFQGATKGICTLQEWKYTLYGIPSAAVIESVNPSPESSPVEASKKTTVASPQEKPAPKPWERSTLRVATEDIVDSLSELASLSAARIVNLFAGSPNEDERVASAMPIFAQNALGRAASAQGTVAHEATSTTFGHVESLRKLLHPRIAAARRLFKRQTPIALGALSAGCFFSYGALFPRPDAQPPTEHEVKESRIAWQDAAEATLEGMEVTFVTPKQHHDWEVTLAEQAQWSPYEYSYLDFVLAAAEGRVGERTIQLPNETRTIAPGALAHMLARDIRSAATSHTTTWTVTGPNLDVHAAQRALSDIADTGTVLVPHESGDNRSPYQGTITWHFVGSGETDDVTIAYSTKPEGDRRQLGQQWSYRIGEESNDMLAALRRTEGRILKKTYGAAHWQAPVDALKRGH